MTETRQLLIVNPTRGMDRSQFSHVVGRANLDTWYYQHNFRVENNELVYIPGERSLVSFTNVGDLILSIIPVQQPGAEVPNILTLTERSAFLYAGEEGPGVTSLWVLDNNGGSPGYFNYPTNEDDETDIEEKLTVLNNFKRWSYVVYGGNVFFTNLDNKVQIFRYNSFASEFEVRTLDDSDPTATSALGNVDPLLPKAKYIAMLEGHIVCAHTKEDHYWDGDSAESMTERTFPERVRWGQRDVIGQALYDWFPGTGFNADFKDINSNQGLSEFSNEITGMNVLRNTIALYTRNGIWEMTYVGPASGIMNFRQAVAGVGCHFPYSVVVGVDVHYFIGLDNFYMFNGSSVSPIGQKIWSFFRESISLDKVEAEKTWAWARTSQHQIWWFYISNDSFAPWCFDKIIIYDWVADIWQVQSARAVFSAVELNTTIDTGGTALVRALMFGAAEGNLLVEMDFTNDVDKIEYINHGVLITQDLQFDDPEAVKEVNRVYIDADLETVLIDNGSYKGSVTWGLCIYVSVRNRTSDPLQFRYAGMWMKEEESEYAPVTVRTAGRILNFAFVPMINSIITDDESSADLAILFEKTNANV